MSDPERRKGERRQVNRPLLHIRMIAEDLDATGLVAAIDILASQLLREDLAHGYDMLLQQVANVRRKYDPATLAGETPAVAQDVRPEGAGSASGACSPFERKAALRGDGWVKGGGC